MPHLEVHKMRRRNFVRIGGSIAGLGVLGATPAFGAEHNPPEYPPGKTTHRGNWIRGQAEDVEVTSVVKETSDPDASNFEEEFDYYVVHFEEQTYDTYVYREPARLGGGNFVSEYDNYVTSSAFWYGVTGQDSEGIQHEIVHDGQVIQYFETKDGWTELTAKFDDGELIDVNGVEPE